MFGSVHWFLTGFDKPMQLLGSINWGKMFGFFGENVRVC